MSDYRVVILGREGELPAEQQLAEVSPECVCVSSGYEAAAELLAGSCGAMVIDLSCLTAARLKLLDLARQCGVEMLGVGALPAGLSAGDLRGMKLVSVSELPDILQAAARDARASGPAEEPIRLTPARSAEFHPEPKQATAPAKKPK